MVHLNDNLVHEGPHPNFWLTKKMVLSCSTRAHVKHVEKLLVVGGFIGCGGSIELSSPTAIVDVSPKQIILPSEPKYIEFKMVVDDAGSTRTHNSYQTW